MEVVNASNEQCLQRNIHNRTMEDIVMAAEQWQPTPPTYPLLDLGSLLGVNKKKAKQVGIVVSAVDLAMSRSAVSPSTFLISNVDSPAASSCWELVSLKHSASRVDLSQTLLHGANVHTGLSQMCMLLHTHQLTLAYQNWPTHATRNVQVTHRMSSRQQSDFDVELPPEHDAFTLHQGSSCLLKSSCKKYSTSSTAA